MAKVKFNTTCLQSFLKKILLTDYFKSSPSNEERAIECNYTPGERKIKHNGNTMPISEIREFLVK